MKRTIEVPTCPEPTDAFLTLLSRQSDAAEQLLHSMAFDMAMLKNMTRIDSFVTMSSMELRPDELPPELVEVHSFPSRFEVEDFTAVLTVLPAEQEDNDTDEAEENGINAASKQQWLLDAKYKIGDSDYALLADQDKTTITTTNYAGNPLHYNFSGDLKLANRFLASLTIGLIRSGYNVNVAYLPQQPSTDPGYIEALMRCIGSGQGVYQSTVFAEFETEGTATVLSTRHDAERLGYQFTSLQHHMVYEIGESAVKHVLTELRETESFNVFEDPKDGNIITTTTKTSKNVAGRLVSEVTADNLELTKFFDAMEEEAPVVNHKRVKRDERIPTHTNELLPEQQLTAKVHPLEYGTINALIMSVLRPHLQKYVHLDEPPVHKHAQPFWD